LLFTVLAKSRPTFMLYPVSH